MGHLMKQFAIGLLTMTLGAVGTTGSRAQEVSYIIPTPKAELLQTASKAKLLAAANNGLKANYKTPVPLANLGTISQGDNASCNYLFIEKLTAIPIDFAQNLCYPKAINQTAFG